MNDLDGGIGFVLGRSAASSRRNGPGAETAHNFLATGPGALKVGYCHVGIVNL